MAQPLQLVALRVGHRLVLVCGVARSIGHVRSALSRISSISFEASALVRSSLNWSGVPACSHSVLRYEACAPVIGSSPDTQSSGSFCVLPTGRVFGPLI